MSAELDTSGTLTQLLSVSFLQILTMGAKLIKLIY